MRTPNNDSEPAAQTGPMFLRSDVLQEHYKARTRIAEGHELLAALIAWETDMERKRALFDLWEQEQCI
jgi:hypothetical protein